MNKGKNFTAAEKYFQDKEVKLKKEIQTLTTRTIDQAKHIKELEDELQAARGKIEEQKDWIDRLLQYTELTQEDIASACKKDKELAECAKMLLGVSNFMSRF